MIVKFIVDKSADWVLKQGIQGPNEGLTLDSLLEIDQRVRNLSNKVVISQDLLEQDNSHWSVSFFC